MSCADESLTQEKGGYPAEGFGFDLNGFTGAPGPRFGDRSSSPTPQEDPIRYPFTSYAGDVSFTEPLLGTRKIDFNHEGLVHIGLLPELIEDARGDAASYADLQPLFRSAEGYLPMWERAEARAKALRGPPDWGRWSVHSETEHAALRASPKAGGHPSPD